uniref:Uncharacterized protein n=1 Tax=Kalanchoe fedtschenkoi TaxID=63787 RepID=A0A7N0UZD3_KALFE
MAATRAAEPQPAFPAADAAAELHPGVDKGVKVDPISADVATSLEIKERMEAAERERAERKKKDAMQTLKKTIIVSGIIAALAGAAFAVAKKMKEKQ